MTTETVRAEILKSDPMDRFPSLAALCEGGLDEQFAYALEKIAYNIMDENTNPVTPRSVNIKITFTPDMTRNFTNVKAEVGAPKLAPDTPITTSMQIGKNRGEVTMIEMSTLGE